jgi:quercetin dioxygenase-like cupin family protein
MALFIVPSWRYVGRMKDRRQFLQAGVATGLGLTVLGFSEAPDTFSMRTIYQRDLPAVNLAGWQVTALELVYPPGMNAPKHLHPGFILGYILDGDFRFQLEGGPETVLSSGEMFYEAPGQIHLPSGSASTTKPARLLALAFGEKGKEITKPL